MIPSEDAAKRLGAAVQWVERQYRNPGLRGVKVVRNRGGGCVSRNEIWKFGIGGTPTGGSFTFDLNVLGVTDTMTFNFDDTFSDIITALETHTNIASGDVSVAGGPFPDADITIVFQGDLANTRFPPPTTIDKSGLTGGTGTSVVFGRYQPGHPTDGSVAP